MTEEQKHAVLFAAALLSAWTLIETIVSDKPNMAKEYFVGMDIKRGCAHPDRINKRRPVRR